MNRLILALTLCLAPHAALARPVAALPATRPLTANCVADAAREHDLPLAALIGILAVEGGKTGEATRNANGSWDLGAFQVNTVHINELERLGMPSESVLRDGCVNARAAARILRREYDRTGDIWQAVGAYHSRTPHLRDAYIGRVKQHLARLGKNGLNPEGLP
jgi:hypothetical protein